MKLRVCTLFSGYDSQCMALDRLKEKYPQFDYELVAWAEIDKFAIAAHNAVYPQWSDRNYGDVSKIDWDQVPDFDLLTYYKLSSRDLFMKQLKKLYYKML